MAESVFNVAEGVRNWGIEYLAICNQAKYPAMTGESHVFFVDGTTAVGDDSAAHNGQFPDAPLLTITAAIGKCTANKDDFIFVLNYPSASYTNEATKPITISKSKIHLLGTPLCRGPFIKPTADTAGILVSANANYCEIAGLDIRAGATHGCIEIGSGYTWGLEIHDCLMGHEGSGQDGFKSLGDAAELRIWGCIFGDLLTRDGVRIGSPGNATRGLIGVPGKPNNIFRHVGGVAIDIVSAGTDLAGIYDNRILTGSGSSGEGITFPADSGNKCHIDGNRATYQKTNGGTTPFLEGGTNHWGLNYHGDIVAYPA